LVEKKFSWAFLDSRVGKNELAKKKGELAPSREKSPIRAVRKDERNSKKKRLSSQKREVKEGGGASVRQNHRQNAIMRKKNRPFFKRGGRQSR